jgi:hypothetical protein
MAEEKPYSIKSTLVPEASDPPSSGASPFLPYQDPNGDGLPDVCDIEVVPSQQVCKDCIPNPNAIVKDWRRSDQDSPFLNAKICKYQICFNTPETTTGFVNGMSEEQADRALNDLYEKYAEPALIALLEGFQKDTGAGIVSQVLPALEYTGYDLDTRPSSRLKLLYSVNFSQIFSLPDEDLSEEDDQADSEEDITVTYEASDMVTTNIRVRKGLNLYGRFYKVGRAVEGKKIRVRETNKLFDFEKYGDNALFTGKSPVGACLRDLDAWLNSRGYNITGIGNIFNGFGDDKVIKLDFIFSAKYKLKKLKVYTEACGTNEPDATYGPNKLKGLNAKDSWKDPTAVAYFAKMKSIEQDLSARVPMPFEEFVVKHTYPEVLIDASRSGGATSERTIASCVGDALINDAKELGQDIFDDVFSLADAIAYKFHKNLCQSDPTKVDEEAILKGLNIGGPAGPTSDVYNMAKNQALKEVKSQDSAFAELCFRMISIGTSGVACGLSPLQQLDQMYAEGLDRAGICGLMDLFLEALQCLFKGLTLEEALASIVRAALNAMGVRQIGELFIGLPPEKQAELQRVVNQKLESGDIFAAGSPGQSTSDILAGKQNAPDPVILKKFKNKKPWEDKGYVEREESNKRSDNYGNMVASKAPGRPADDSRERRTIGQKLESPLGDDYQTNNVILNAYIEAIMEVYQDNYLELIDFLNKFPGAKLITNVIAFMDCPTPPLFNPGFDDFFKSLQLPFCRSIAAPTFPRWENPFLYIPKLTDILKAIFAALKKLVLCIIMKVIVTILSKVCEIIGDAICKAIELAGKVTAGLLTGNADLAGILRETICGPDASDEQINATALDLMANFGVGGAAFSDPERTKAFFGDVMNNSNRQEGLQLMIDGPSDAQIRIADTLLDEEYQEFREALPNRSAIRSMFEGISNVVPERNKDEIRAALEMSADELSLPANPTICATPEDIENFEKVRCDLLAGRMSPEQCRQQSARARDQLLEDANDIQRVINDGFGSAIENEMPPIFSDPGCENGLLPFEPEESIKTATGALKGDMESLQIAFTDDMLGNGGLFAGDDDWGMINMILSDTFANPYTAHQRKTANSRRFVDFYLPNEDDEDGNIATEKRQKGAYPQYVAEWLKYQFQGSNNALDLKSSFIGGFKGTNDVQELEVNRISFSDLGFTGLFDTDVNLVELQDYGYNVNYNVNYEKDLVAIRRAPRKKTADITMKFRDNAKGYRNSSGEPSYGFNLKAYYSDIQEVDQEERQGFFNIPNDNIRVVVDEAVFDDAQTNTSDLVKLNPDLPVVTATTTFEADALFYQKYEFFAIDPTFENLEVDRTEFSQLFDSFGDSVKRYSPQVYALSDMTGIGPQQCKILYDSNNTKLFKEIAKEIGNNEEAWQYGAEFDGLMEEDFDYGVIVDGEFVEYKDHEVQKYDDDGNRDGTRSVKNSDSLLGVSRDAWKNQDNPDKIRVHYLNPAQFGNSYMSPSLYVKPLKNKGWLGAVNLIFPEYSPCKPRENNLISFDTIKQKIDEVYPRIPEDKRLKSDPDCVTEMPFNRILSRPSRAGLEALVTATIRIFTSVSYIKSMPTFLTFAPKFDQNYSNIYASYIIELIEESCKEAGSNFLSPFKDDEFWYAFLEQAVQVYSRRLDDDLDDSITPETVPAHVREAIEKINDMQENYNYPSRDDFKDAPSEEKSLFQSLKSFREEKNLEAVQRMEEPAKFILTELVREQLEFVGGLFSTNIKEAGFTPKVINNDYYLLEKFAAGANGLDLAKAISFVDRVDNSELESIIESEGSGYTTGGLFTLPDGTPYVGDYHVNVGADGNPVFMVGEYHVTSDHDVLIPYANNLKVGYKDINGNVQNIGDISNYNDAIDPAGKMFYIKKFVSINGIRQNVQAAENTIRSRGTANISTYYPGNMRVVREPTSSRVVGIEGDLGVQHGIEFGIINNGSQVKITDVLINALDLPVNEFEGPRANSKLLLCLIDNLRDDVKFRMIVDYIFSMKKALSLNAIYNDIGLLPSVGEFTVDNNDYKSSTLSKKPGVRADIGTDADGNNQVVVNATPGWAHESDRNGFFASPFYKKWDEWDQILLRKSTKRIKKLFKPYYTKRKFEVEDDTDAGPGEQFLSITKSRFTPVPGGNKLTWFKRRKLKPNPFDGNGQLCKKPN